MASIQKKGKNKYRIRVYLKERNPITGKYQYIDKNIQAKNKREAENITLKDYLLQWLKSRKSILKITTYENYELIANCHLIPSLGHIKLHDLKPFYFDRYLDEKRENGRRQRKGGLSERSL